MYYDDHGPPHFHAYYENDSALMEIETLKMLSGNLPRRALSMVREWAALHRDELTEDWRLAEAHEALLPIESLE